MDKPQMQRQHYATIVYGASFLGLGLAAADPQNTLLIEPGCTVGAEFIDTFAVCSVLTPPASPFALSLFTDLQTRGVIKDQSLDLMKTLPALMNQIRQAGLHIQFLSRVYKIDYDHGQARNNIHYLRQEDHRILTCDRYIDTTTCMARLNDLQIPVHRAIHALLHRGSTEWPDVSAAGGKLHRLDGGSLGILALPLDKDDQPNTCRTAVLSCTAHFGPGNDCRLLAIAGMPFVSLPYQERQIGPAAWFVPSCSCLDPFDALNRAATVGG